MQALGSQDWLQAVIVLAGALGLAVGLIRSLSVLLGPLNNLLLEREERDHDALAALGWRRSCCRPSTRRSGGQPLSAAVAAFAVAPGG